MRVLSSYMQKIESPQVNENELYCIRFGMEPIRGKKKRE